METANFTLKAVKMEQVSAVVAMSQQAVSQSTAAVLQHMVQEKERESAAGYLDTGIIYMSTAGLSELKGMVQLII